MEEQANLVISCFKDSFFYRSLTDPLSIDSTFSNEKSLLESMIIYQEVHEYMGNKVSLNDVSYRNGKYYLRGRFLYGENKNDAILYPSNETIFNSKTKINIYGYYESIAEFVDEQLIFETSFGGYKTTVGGNYDGTSLIDMLEYSTTDVCKNYIDRISGTLEEKYIYNELTGLYTHSSKISKDNEILYVDKNYRNSIFRKGTNKSIPERINKYAYLKNQRDILLEEIQRQSLYEGRNKQEKKSKRKENVKIEDTKYLEIQEQKQKRLSRRKKNLKHNNRRK